MNLGDSVYQIKRNFQAQGIQLACDIDDTLAETSAAFFRLLSAKFPPPESLTISHLKKHYALTGKALHWQDIPEATSYAHGFIDDPEFHAPIDPLDGAATGMQQLHQQNMLACYLTVRTETMRNGTERWLPHHGFPNLPLAMRKEMDITSNIQWKVAALEYLFPQVQGIIDNDARIARLLEERRYKGKVFLLGLNEKEYAPSNTVTPIENWPELIERLLHTREQ